MKFHEECPWIILATTNDGSVRQCQECGSMRIDFGNIRLQFTPDQFSRFRKFVADLDIERCECLNGMRSRCIAIDLQKTGVVVTFTREEFKELRLLLQKATGESPEKLSKPMGLVSPLEWAQQRMN